jgi:hypothetical protein
MVICIESSVLGGYLSNEVPGLVTGMLHLAGQRQPMRIELTGNFLRDIAGCRVDIHNPLPEADATKIGAMELSQAGQTGVMTASYRVGKIARRKSTLVGGYALPEPPGLKNLLFFEWFNQQGQRVLIQSWHLQLRVSTPRWQLSKDAEMALIRQNRARRKHFLLGNKSKPKPPPAETLAAPTLEDPFAPDDTTRDPFLALDTLPSPSSKAEADIPVDPLRRAAALAEELRRFEWIMAGKSDVRSRPAVLHLLATVTDLAAHLSHALKQFAEMGKARWHFLVTDLEQSLPIFGAALNACDRLMAQSNPETDMNWLENLHRCLLTVELRMRELLMLLREV